MNGNTAHVIAEITASDSTSDVIFYNSDAGFTPLKEMLDPERSVLAADVSVPEKGYVAIALMNYSIVINGEEDPDMIQFYIGRNAGELESYVDILKAAGHANVTVEYETDADAESSADAYIIHVLDQNGDPVP